MPNLLLSVTAVCVIAAVVWVGRIVLRRRRRARVAAELAKYRPAGRNAGGEPRRPIPVDELVARIEAERRFQRPGAR
jgi:hypothetical protein